jgi:hypothetical protein
MDGWPRSLVVCALPSAKSARHTPPRKGRPFAVPQKVRAMDAALIDIAGAQPRAELDTAHMRDIVLARIAFAGRPVPRDGLAKELAPIAAHVLGAEAFKAILERDLATLADAGLIDLKPSSVTVTPAGHKRAALVLGGRGAPPKTWTEARDVRLVAKALGMADAPPQRLRALAKPNGLRAALVVKSFSLKVRGVASETRLRSALAQVALARAFGDDTAASGSKGGLSPKAARALAGRLARTPQDFRTDGRLISALAADHVGATSGDHGSLQLAVLRRYVTKGQVGEAAVGPVKRKRKAVRSIERRAKAAAAVPAPAPAAAAVGPSLAEAPPPTGVVRPDLEAFVGAVNDAALRVAEGWAGNRKAFISRAWQEVRARRPEWAMTEIEFKCMLAEAHRVGRVILTNADLKDGPALKEVKDSAVAYRNAVFHFIRLDA